MICLFFFYLSPAVKSKPICMNRMHFRMKVTLLINPQSNRCNNNRERQPGLCKVTLLESSGLVMRGLKKNAIPDCRLVCLICPL